jgi:hypothetical protein
MSIIDVTTAQESGLRDDPTAAWESRDPAVSGLSQRVVDRAVARGRRLRSQAILEAGAGLGRWVFSTVKAAVGRRATSKLGCGECGNMMRA